ncbi:MAG: rod shape-determining protein MreC [Campylobacterales bacterium]|nr:rod shape-determining protein MreC [Campylobacterales bacterium]
MSSKLKFFFIIGVFIFISLKYGGDARGVVADFSTSVTTGYLTTVERVKTWTEEYLAQRDAIRILRAHNSELERSALLSIAFAGKLNALLKDHERPPYAPSVKLVQAVSYVNLSNYHRVWLDFEDANQSRIYGLLHQGNTAGIVIFDQGRPLGLLQGDPKSIFSVSVGEDNIPGVAMGNNQYIQVRYIPMWMEPKVGDEVTTSGMDEIFFAGVPVGKVIEVIQEESYQSAVVLPYTQAKAPMYMYVVE